MLIELLLDGLYSIMSLLMVLEIPSLPDNVTTYIEEGFSYVSAGAGIVANYTPLEYLMILFGILLAIDGGLMLYKFIMWILKKIPVLNIK